MTGNDDATWFTDGPKKGKKRSSVLRVAVAGDRRRFERGDHLELAQALLQHVEPTAEHRVHDEGALHRYDPTSGLWVELDRSTQARAVHTFAGAVVPTEKGVRSLLINTSTVDGTIEQAAHIAHQRGFFADAPVGLAFSDGFAHATSEGITWDERRPDHRARVGYPFPCPPLEAPCPRWLAFLRSVWPVTEEDEGGARKAEEDIQQDRIDQDAKIRLVQQFLGACLVGIATRFQMALVLFGAGSNGKSTLLKTAERLFPKGSLSHVAPQDLGDEYRLALLAGKRLNTVGELPTSEIMASDRFKAIVDGSEVTGRQIRQEPITFAPRAGHVYSANAYPPVSDMSHGFWSRFVILRFSQVFERGTAGEDLDAIMAREEGPAIIGWMLDGATSVLKSRGYTIPPSSKAEIERWRRRADTVAGFLEECCEVPKKGATKEEKDAYWTAGSTLFKAYCQWCEDSKRKGVSKQAFADRMESLGHKMRRTSRSNVYPVDLKRAAEHSS